MLWNGTVSVRYRSLFVCSCGSQNMYGPLYSRMSGISFGILEDKEAKCIPSGCCAWNAGLFAGDDKNALCTAAEPRSTKYAAGAGSIIRAGTANSYTGENNKERTKK